MTTGQSRRPRLLMKMMTLSHAFPSVFLHLEFGLAGLAGFPSPDNESSRESELAFSCLSDPCLR